MILVTGATGHLGNVLVRELLARGETVRAMVLPGDDCAPIQGLAVERVEGDVLSPADLDRALAGVEIVYHLAGIISIRPGNEDFMRRVNVDGARNVAEAALRAGVRRLVHTSSVHAFQRRPHGTTVDETTPLAPDSPGGAYDRTKAEGTLAVLGVVRQGLDAVIACPSGVIGPYDYRQSEMGRTILGFFSDKINWLVDGAYDFVDVRDVAQGLILACERGRSGEVYILSGEQIRIIKIRELVHRITGIKSPMIVIPFSIALFAARFVQKLYQGAKKAPQFTSYALQTIYDNSLFSHAKAERELGYRPRPLSEAISDFILWWMRQRALLLQS